MLNQTPSTNYGSSQRISLNGDKDSPQSRFAVKCIIFTAVAVLGFILMLLFSSSSNASDDTVSHIRTLATKASHQSKEELTYRVNFHICDTAGAGEDLDRAYSPEYFLQISTAQGTSDPLSISTGLSKDGYIGEQYKLSGLGRNIKSITFIANNNEPICIDSITTSVDPFDARGSIEKAWVTQSHEFLVSNVCNGDDTENSQLSDRFLYFVGVSIDNIYNDKDSSSAKLSIQLTGRNGKKSEVFQLNEEGGKLMKDEYYVRLYESDISLGNKIDNIDIFFPDDEDIDGIHINQILAGSASNPGAVTMTADTDWWFKTDCDDDDEKCGKVKSFDAVCFGANVVDDDEKEEQQENNFIDAPKKGGKGKGKGAKGLKKNKRGNK